MYVIGLDGGGTRTTAVVADGLGRELARRVGGAGIVDPRWPHAAVEAVVNLVREVSAAAGLERPAAALCAGLAGTGDREAREVVRHGLETAGIAGHVLVLSDGEIALEGALAGRSGLLLVAGTGSVAWGRSPDGRVERCGGWGWILGDEGSAYWLGREALRAVLRADDGRGPPTRLVEVRETLNVSTDYRLVSRVATSAKGDIAALAPAVLQAALGGDAVAHALVHEAVEALGEHAVALAARLGPWDGEVPVVLHGGLATEPRFAAMVAEWLAAADIAFRVAPPAADPAAGAVSLALRVA